mmetsp:Transcript_21868/g.39391  ORF Transcript_21868/g.39391 Transcript_21868/m.39391 type:complete len:368 (+) Transcript_21868:44-1147(+)
MSLEALAFALGTSWQKSQKKQKKQKQPYKNWFEKLQLDELKSLCRASRLPVSGTKATLCERLCSGELSRIYAYEYAPERLSRARFEYDMSFGETYGNDHAAAQRPAQQGSKRASALSNEDLKTMCREKGIIVSGKRYDLVLRLLQFKSGRGDPKRAAGAMDEEGKFQPKKRAKSMKLPDVEKIKQRTFKKFFPSDEVTSKWSNNKYKYHPPDCIKFASSIIEKEIFEKELFERGEEKLAWEVINALLYRITVGNVERRREWAEEQRGEGGGLFMMIGGTDMHLGRCSSDLKYEFLPKIVKATKATSSKIVLEESGIILWDFQTRKLSECSEFDEVFIAESEKPTGEKSESFKEILNDFVPRKMEATT